MVKYLQGLDRWLLTSDTVLTFKPFTMTLADPEGQEGGAAVQEEERLRPGGGRAPRARSG